MHWLSTLIPYTQPNSFLYLYTITFIRSGDYFGLYIRLTCIGSFILYFFVQGYSQVVLVIITGFLTGFQLLPLRKHHQYKIWVTLYPVNHEERILPFQKLLSRLLYCQTAALSILILVKGELLTAFVTCLVGSVFSYGYVYLYSKNKLKHNKKIA
ncbi:ABC transporter permease [Bacillus spongiae]|uniref:ABC transporter permease n=1 Tax=Bacillus spongiae TaxID=2683610 RepID=UPI003AF42DBC